MPAWSRRALLRTLGAGTSLALAGCSAGEEASSTTTGTPSTTTSTETTQPTSTTTTDAVLARDWSTTGLDAPVQALWLPNSPPGASQTGGPLYAGTGGGTVLNLVIGSGRIRWSHDAAGSHDGHDHPRVLEGPDSLYVVSQTWNEQTQRNYVEALDRDSGDRLWDWDAGEFLTPIGLTGGRLYLRGFDIRGSPEELGVEVDPKGDGHVHALDVETGDVSFSLDYPRLRDAAVAHHGLYVVADDPEDGTTERLIAHELDGTERWSTGTGLIDRVPLETVADGVLAGAKAGVGFYQPADPEPVWTTSEGAGWPQSISVVTEGQFEDTIFVGTEPLVALALDGSERWRLPRGGAVVPGSPLGQLVIDQPTGITGVDPDDGSSRFEYTPATATSVDGLLTTMDAVLVDHDVWTRTEFGVVDETGTLAELVVTPEPYEAMTAMFDEVFVGTESGVIAYQLQR